MVREKNKNQNEDKQDKNPVIKDAMEGMKEAITGIKNKESFEQLQEKRIADLDQIIEDLNKRSNILISERNHYENQHKEMNILFNREREAYKAKISTLNNLNWFERLFMYKKYFRYEV